ncbi:MAG TPA: rhodanese-like domain-containing protein [Bacillota bacterium]|nr:rhodanese-like domain-containing protein [Bacillota bacterium]
MHTLNIAGLGILILAVIFTGYMMLRKKEGAKNMDQANTSIDSYQDISGRDLQRMISSQEDLIIVDVRQSEEYALGHIRGAVLIPLGELVKRLGEIEYTKTVAVVCASGSRSAKAASYLVSQGYARVLNLTGGMYAWSGEVIRGGNEL